MGISIKSRASHTICIFLDISKAFDRIWHDGLLHKLHEQFEIHGDIFILLVYYFKNRKTCVKVGNEYSYEYDDEGTPSSVTPLIREGELLGRLHSKETASKMSEAPTGNARAISYAYPPIVRMTNTIIENGSNTKEEIINDTKDGLYVKNWYGGMTEHEMFTFSSAETYKIENGEIKETLRPVKLS